MYFLINRLSLFAEESSDDEDYEAAEKSFGGSKMDIEEEDGSDDEMNVMENNINWRDNLAEKARASYLERQSNTQNLMKIVYGAVNAVSKNNYNFNS